MSDYQELLRLEIQAHQHTKEFLTQRIQELEKALKDINNASYNLESLTALNVIDDIVADVMNNPIPKHEKQ
jgi:hypothetical protein